MAGGTAQSLKAEGLRLFQEGLYEEALRYFGQAQEQFAAEGNDAEAAEMLNNQGVVYRVLHRWEEARAALEEARAVFARIGDRHREAQALGNLGGLLASRGDSLRAQEYLRQAADLFTELGDNQRRAETLLALGVQMWKAGDRWGGIAAYQAGLEMLERPTPQQKTLRGLIRLASQLFRLRLPAV
ncbi:MAG: tetratricopeptide repeat protein [Anaerolineae bacterium]